MRAVCVFALSVIAFALPANAAMIISTFDTDLDGWSISNTIGEQWMGSGGNPGGYAHIDNNEGQIAIMDAPAKFLGDLTAYDGELLCFDAIQLDDGGQPWDNFQNFGRLAIFDSLSLGVSVDLVPGTTGPPPTWTRYSIPLTAAAWGVSQSIWLSILSNVSAITLSVEGLFGPEVNGVDNFKITPEPASLTLALLGFGSLLMPRRR